MLKEDLKASDEDFDHFLNHNLELLFNYVNQYYLAEKNYIICVSPQLFDISDQKLGISG